jgi:hypothetical protein
MLPTNDYKLASYHLISDGHGKIRDRYNKHFDPASYSRMKWGIIADARKFAQELVVLLRQIHPDLSTDARPPGIVVAYQSLPHAATIVSHYCLEIINQHRRQANNSPGRLIHIFAPDYQDDYASSDACTRQNIIAAQKSELKLSTKNLDHFHLILIDDMCVTGATTQSLLDLLRTNSHQPIITAYIAILDNQLAKQSPYLESQLDSAGISTIEELLPFIKMNQLVPTYRLHRELSRRNDDIDQVIQTSDIIPKK